MFYENYVGSIVDWYAATLFRREPVLTFEGNERRRRHFSRSWWRMRTGEGRRWRISSGGSSSRALVTGTSYVLVDFPRVTATAGDARAKKMRRGRRGRTWWSTRADDVINWSLDEHGNFEWVVIRTKQIKKDRVEDPEWRTETRWAYYDKQNLPDLSRIATGAARSCVLVDEGTHGLAKLGQSAAVRAADSGRAVDAEPGGLAATGALQ